MKTILAHIEGTIFGVGANKRDAREDAEKYWDSEWAIDDALASKDPDKHIYFEEVDDDFDLGAYRRIP